MTRTELESFLAVVQAGSLSAAAKNLYITQPALSRRIQSLEQELGYPLLQRSPGVRKATLTAQGEQFVSLATQWMGIWNETALRSACCRRCCIFWHSVIRRWMSGC